MSDDFILEEYASHSDEELAELSCKGDSGAFEALAVRYKGMVRHKCRGYFLIGGDREDILQEGMIGLLKAVRDYDRERVPVFYPFADLCITRQVFTAIKASQRQKHMPLNTYISLNSLVFGNNDKSERIEMVATEFGSNPEECMLSEERHRHINSEISSRLSELERKALKLYLSGMSYQEIAEGMNKSIKSVDNTIQRIRRKLIHILEI